MRPLLHGDLAGAARALKLVQPGRRQAACRSWIRKAELADLHRKETGEIHLDWGNGSLMSVAFAQPKVDEPSFDDADYCRCFIVVLEEILRHKLCNRDL